MEKKNITFILRIVLIGFLIYLIDNISFLIQGFKADIGF